MIYLVEYYGEDINKQDSSGRTPLHYAYMNENKEMINYLNKCGSRKDIRDKFGHIAENFVTKPPQEEYEEDSYDYDEYDDDSYYN